jgi:hypothetical protein
MRLYRALLRFYPASFRNEYGDEMCAVFERRRASPVAVLFEVLFHAAAVHLDLLRQDVRYAARTWRRTPGFAVAAVLVVSLGIGATTAVFSLADHVLFRPLPFPESDRLVTLWEVLPGYSRMEPSPANYRDWQRMSTVFQGAGAYTGGSINMTGAGEPERVEYALVSGELLQVLGVRPLMGRGLTLEDDRPDAPRTVLISYGLWRAVFAADPYVLGREIQLGDTRTRS